MNIDCRVIGDLLPLYADESCSDASRALVDSHLKTCPRCRETLARMKSERFLPAAQAIDPPAVADYAQKVKHRRQKRGTLLTVGVIVLIVLLSLTVAAWMNLVRAQHPYVPVVEEERLQPCRRRGTNLCRQLRRPPSLRTARASPSPSARIRRRTARSRSGTSPMSQSPTRPCSTRSTDARALRIHESSSAERYFVLCDGLSGAFSPTDARRTFGRAFSICSTPSSRADGENTAELTKAFRFSTIKAVFQGGGARHERQAASHADDKGGGLSRQAGAGCPDRNSDNCRMCRIPRFSSATTAATTPPCTASPTRSPSSRRSTSSPPLWTIRISSVRSPRRTR